jgi:hypothetical protein
VLPQYGFYARVPGEGGIEAAIERRDGVIVDWSVSPGAQFVNARPVVSDRLPLTVAVASVRYLGNRRFETHFRWVASGPIPDGYRIFVHWVDAAGNIVFQGDHTPPVPMGQWSGLILTTGTSTVPQSASAGQSWDLRVGLYLPSGGARLLPEGQDDGTRRIMLGSLRWTGSDVVFTAYQAPPDPLLPRLNPTGQPIGFGAVTTSGALRLAREGDALVITPLPGGPPFEVRVRLDRAPGAVEALDEARQVLSGVAVRFVAGELVLDRDPAVFAYRVR